MALPNKISFAKSPLQLKLDRREAKKTGRFIALFVLLYLLLSFASNAIFLERQMQNFIASLTASSFNGALSYEENPIVSIGSIKIEISALCTGLTELFIIVSAILASIGISLRKRLAGVVLSAFAVFLLNIFRIFATIAIILSTGSSAAVEIAHNILFRLFLFISIVAIYVVWFYWAVRKEKPKGS